MTSSSSPLPTFTRIAEATPPFNFPPPGSPPPPSPLDKYRTIDLGLGSENSYDVAWNVNWNAVTGVACRNATDYRTE